MEQLPLFDEAPQETPLKRCTGSCEQEYPATTEFWHRQRGKLASRCKKCQNQADKDWRNRPDVQERLKAYRKEYYSRPGVQEHGKKRRKEYYSRPDVKERQSAYAKKHHKEYYNRTDIKERVKAYNKSDAVIARRKERNTRPDVKEHAKEYRDRVRQHRLELGRIYRSRPEIQELRKAEYKINREQYIARARNRSILKRSIAGIHAPQQIKDQLKRQKHKCYYCQKRLQKAKGKYIYHIEHTFPLSRVAGTNIPANSIDYLVLSCPTCNLSKGNKFPWEFAEGGRLL